MIYRVKFVVHGVEAYTEEQTDLNTIISTYKIIDNWDLSSDVELQKQTWREISD